MTVKDSCLLIPLLTLRNNCQVLGGWSHWTRCVQHENHCPEHPGGPSGSFPPDRERWSSKTHFSRGGHVCLSGRFRWGHVSSPSSGEWGESFLVGLTRFGGGWWLTLRLWVLFTFEEAWFSNDYLGAPSQRSLQWCSCEPCRQLLTVYCLLKSRNITY